MKTILVIVTLILVIPSLHGADFRRKRKLAQMREKAKREQQTSQAQKSDSAPIQDVIKQEQPIRPPTLLDGRSL